VLTYFTYQGGKMLSRKKLAVAVLTVSALIASSAPAYAATLNGSGATFAQPLIDSCKVDFNKETGHTINYTGGGSGTGRTNFSNSIGDFAGSDTAYTQFEPSYTVYAPIYLAPAAVMYNLPTVKEPINLTPATIAQIFSGYITNWDDKIIAADNERTIRTPIFKTVKRTVKDKNGKNVTKTVPAVDKKGKPIISSYSEKVVNIDLPKLPITVWYRTDSSGTSGGFTEFLKGANAGANERLWPKASNNTFSNATPNNISTFFNFQGGSGSAAVAAGVAGKVGAIGYGELSFALDNKLGVANVQNAAGEFTKPDAAGSSAFVGGGTINANGTVTVDYKKAITGAYPLGLTSYALAYSSGKDATKQKLVADWFTYVLDKCPGKYPEKGFSQITGPLYNKAKEQIAKIK
jgi:phosphate transport system substrate-binding protein